MNSKNIALLPIALLVAFAIAFFSAGVAFAEDEVPDPSTEDVEFTLEASGFVAGVDGTMRFDLAAEELELVNEERVANGLEPLVMNYQLQRTAMLRVVESVYSYFHNSSQYYSHLRSNGQSCFTAFPDGWYGGENLGLRWYSNGVTSANDDDAVEQAHYWWMNSSGHRANILNSRATCVGIACFNYRGYYFFVQNFGWDYDASEGYAGYGSSYGVYECEIQWYGDGPMYRIYNQWTGEHLYTSDYSERITAYTNGWNLESIGWWAPDSGQDVYRMYNPYSGDHHYTMNWSEVTSLRNVGWRYEGVSWYSGGSVPVYREFNPYEATGTHNYTTSSNEHFSLSSSGWQDEGVAWYAQDEG